MPHDHQPAASTHKVFRQPSAHVTGWAFIGLLAVAALLYLIHEPARWYEPIALCGAVGLVVWVVLVRPSVAVTKDGVELHNLVRDVEVPWDDVDLVTRRWNLKVHTISGKKFGSWAISQQRPHRHGHATGSGAFGMPGGIRSKLRNPPEVETTMVDRGSSAEAVGNLIDETKDEYLKLVAHGELTARGRQATVTWSRDPILALAGALVLGIICLVFFT